MYLPNNCSESTHHVLTTLVIKINGDGFSRKSIFRDCLGLSVAGVHRVARSHRKRRTCWM